MSKKEILNKLDEILDNAGVNELLGRKKEEEKCNKVLWVFAIIGAIVAVAAAVYGVYRFLVPEYPDDFDDDFEDEFEDDFFDEDEEMDEEFED